MVMCINGKDYAYNDPARPKNKFKVHKERAAKNNIPFLLTFEEWWSIWQSSGHWDERGRGKGKYVMARRGPDIGPYAIENVDIKTHGENISEAQKGRKDGPQSPERIEKRRQARLGSHCSEETKAKIAESQRQRWANRLKEQK